MNGIKKLLIDFATRCLLIGEMQTRLDVDKYLEDKQTKKLIFKLENNIEKTGGDWLGEAREYIQHNFNNGDSVTWGSDDELKPAASVKKLEELAFTVKENIYKNFRKELFSILISYEDKSIDSDELYSLIEKLK